MNDKTPFQTKLAKLAYSVDEACAALTISRVTLFDLLRRNEIVSVKIGRRRVSFQSAHFSPGAAP